MACYKPLTGVPIGIRADTGKMQYKILPYNEAYYRDGYLDGAIAIPCGKCIGCRLDYSRQWANRCMLERQYHDSAYFVTITYSPEAVPVVTGLSGERALSLRKRDLQLLWKLLRKRFPGDRIRYYAAGEYGDDTQRPHYHAIVFGLHLEDLQLYEQRQDGYNYYTSVTLQNVWDMVQSKCRGGEYQFRGRVIVADCTWETCAYVARYVTTKLSGPEAEYYKVLGVEPPFSVMSRRPGIGRQYYDDHPDLYDYDYINVRTPTGGRKFRPPKYFDRLREASDPDAYGEIKAFRRQSAEVVKASKMSQSDLSYLELLGVEDRALQARLDALKRGGDFGA